MGALCNKAGGDYEESQYFGAKVELKKANIFVGTWNVGNEPPPEDMTPFLPKTGYDMYVIGAQECDYKTEKKGQSVMDHWTAHIQSHFSDTQYELVIATNLQEMRIVIMAAKKFAKDIKNVESDTEATGLAGVYGNKGGVAVALTVQDTRVCFVNTHLAAHQDMTAKRNSDFQEIIRGVDLGYKSGVDILSQFHHVIWMGDLNYRLDYGDQGEERSPSEEQFNKMVAMIENKELDALLAVDQLHAERKAGRAFSGFQEAPIRFDPTFKVERHQDFTYKKKRSPAWCDRVLWKSFPGYNIKNLTYDCCPGILTSDHKPVAATFELEYGPFPRAVEGDAKAKIVISDLKGHDLPAADINNLSDPYIVFHGSFIKDTHFKTSVKKATLDPHWEEDIVIPLKCNTAAHLSTRTLALVAWDWDVGRGDDRLSGGALHLCDFVNRGKVAFDLQLEKGGLTDHKGRLTGKLQIVID